MPDSFQYFTFLSENTKSWEFMVYRHEIINLKCMNSIVKVIFHRMDVTVAKRRNYHDRKSYSGVGQLSIHYNLHED